LETSDAGLNCLEAIERELAEVLVHIVQRHSNRAPLARMPAPDPDALSRDIAELRQSEKKVQGSLELIHGALAHVVDRLGLIEINMRKDVASGRAAPRVGGGGRGTRSPRRPAPHKGRRPGGAPRPRQQQSTRLASADKRFRPSPSALIYPVKMRRNRVPANWPFTSRSPPPLTS